MTNQSVTKLYFHVDDECIATFPDSQNRLATYLDVAGSFLWKDSEGVEYDSRNIPLLSQFDAVEISDGVFKVDKELDCLMS